jgi:phosphate transport system substrate-binding protein
MRKLLPWIAGLAIAGSTTLAQSLDDLPLYRPDRKVSGVIRNWGNNEMASLLVLWEHGFRKYHPTIQFEDKLMGPASAMAGVYTAVADFSWTGHEIWKEESMAFEWIFQYKPLGIEVATSSLDVYDHGAALVVFVHNDNPIGKLSLEQLDGIFGSEHKRGGKNIRNWGDLGLTGDWADKPIHLYGYDAETEAGFFFRHAVLNDSYKWNCDLKEFGDQQQIDGSLVDAGPRIADALSKDRYGIAYSKLRYAKPSIKPLALAATNAGPYFPPVKENVRERTYPLSRIMMVYLNRAPDKPADAKLVEFLRYVLSREGQQAVVHEGGYLPLTAPAAAAQLRKLE